jgi:translation initiation factor 4G
MNMPQGPNSLPQAQHLRRESSQSAHSDMSNANMNRGFPPNAGRGRGGFQPQHYNPNMAGQSPQPYRSIPHQHMGRGMPPAFQPSGPMQQNSPYRQNRSPAITPATMHQQAHLANPQGMPYYQGQPYPQQVRIPSTIYTSSSAPESSKSVLPTAAPRSAQQPFPSLFSHSANSKEPDFRIPSTQPNAFLQSLDSPFVSSVSNFEQYLTFLPKQGMYSMSPQGLDPYNGYYTQPYGLQQSIHFPGHAVPASPGRTHGFPQPMQAPYGVPTPYGQPPQAQGMSRTPSNMSERPSSAVPQPSTPAMTNVSHISHSHTPSVTAASPAPSSTFERPKKQSKAIVIKNGTYPVRTLLDCNTNCDIADGEVVDFNKPKGASPAPAAALAPPAQPRSPAIAATPTPPPPSSSSADRPRTEESASKTAEEKKADFVKQFQEKIRKQEEEEKQAKETSDAGVKAEAEAKQKAEEEAKAKAEQEAKEKEEAEAAEKAKADAAEKQRIEDEEMERMIAEMEEEERKREEEEKKYAEEKKRKAEEEKSKAADRVKEEEERLRKLEREAEEAEKAREAETPEQKAEREAKNQALFAGLKKNTQFGPGANGAEDASGDSTPVEPAAPVAAQAKPTSARSKPAALKLETNKPVEPAQPTAGMQSLKSARFLQVRSELVAYPEGILSPNPALNASSRNKGRQYDKDFLLQFQEVFKEKPSTDWDLKLKESVGDGTDSARPQSARTGSMMGGGRQPSRGGAPGNVMGNFQGFSTTRTLPPGTTSQQRFEQASSGRGPMTNPLAHVVIGGGRGQFPMGAPQMVRQGSYTNMSHGGPNSPRVGSSRGKGSRRGPNKNEQQEAKAMPLTAGQAVKDLERSQTGWKPTSLTSTQPQQASGHMAPDMVQRKVKAALNKMTPEKFDKISDQILEIAAQSKDESDGRTLRQVIQLTFEKACDESHWSSMYAKFCSRMLATMSTDIKDENVRDKHGNPVVGGALFRKYLLNRCQEEFERGWEINLPEAPEEGKEITMLTDEYYIAAAAKRKGLGLIQFIGELYKLGMLTLRIMHECVLKLLDFEGLPDESAIESLVKLLRTVGETMESAEAGPKMINMYFERIEKVMNMEGLPSRLRFMLLDTIDIRKSGWKSKDILKGPKTIAEIHQEAMAAQQAAEMERTRSNQRGGGGGRLPMGRGDARSFSGGGMMPPPDTNSRVQMDDLRKLSKGASGRNMNTGAALGPSMLGSRSGSGRRGLGPGMMGGRDDSGNSSRTGTPPVQKEKESTAHANAFR